MPLPDTSYGSSSAVARYREIVASTPYFTALDDDTLDAITDALKMLHRPAGTTIYLEGEAAGKAPLHIVLDGVVRIYKTSMRGREQTICLFHTGETFADIALFDGGPYPVSADALVDSIIGTLARSTFMDLMHEHPCIATAGTRVLSERLRQYGGLIEDLSLRPVLSRVARLLVNEVGGNLTQGQMATMLGTSREMVNRSLQRLQHAGIIEIRYRCITVRNRPGLLEIIDLG